MSTDDGSILRFIRPFSAGASGAGRSFPVHPRRPQTKMVFIPLSRDENTPQLAPLSTSASDEKAGLAALFLGVAIFDTARLAAR
jgi:hypothetical protein